MKSRQYREQGRCQWCGRPLDTRSSSLCPQHLDMAKDNAKRNKADMRARRKAEGKCIQCGSSTLHPNSSNYCATCRDKYRKWRKKERL